MRTKLAVILAPALALGVLAVNAEAQQHRATRLGNPATRFAKPLKKGDDLRVLLRAEKMKADVAAVLQEVGWAGDLADLDRAAATAEISEVQIPTGTRLDFMAARKNGKAYAMRDVLWAGAKPIDALAFEFSSKCTRYRLVTPKACSNFWVENLGKDTTDPACVEKKPHTAMLKGAAVGLGALAAGASKGPQAIVGGPREVCVGQPVEYTLTVENPPKDDVAFFVNGKEMIKGKLEASRTYTWTFPGAANPGTYEVKAVNADKEVATTVTVRPCEPVCGITVTPNPAKAGKPITVDVSGSKVAQGAAGGIKSVRVEILQKGEVVQTVDMPAPNFTRSDIVVKKSGPTTFRAVVTDEYGRTSTNLCQGDVQVQGGPPVYIGAYFGKERLVHDEPGDHDDDFTGTVCSEHFGFGVGYQPMIGENVQFDGQVGFKFDFDDYAHSSLFIDGAVNYVAGRGFFGGGLSWWDIGKDSGGLGLLVQGGFDVDPDGKWQIVGQARAPFSEFGDLENNYQIWGGIRFRPFNWK